MNIVSNHNRLLRGAAIPTAGGDVYNSGWEYTPQGEISGYSGSAFYQQECPCDSAAIVDSAFNKSTAWVDEQNYLTAHQDVSNLPYVQNSALEFSPQGLISGISGSGLYATSADNAFEAETANFAYNAEHADSADFVATANFANSASSALNAEVANVAYTALTANFLDGGWEHDEDGFITAYNNSAFAGNGGGGRYEGISPIVVNNEEMRISAKSALLGVQDPLYFVEDSETSTVIGIHDSAFPTFEGTEDGKISAINGSALNADSVTEYSGGSNISIVDHVISVTGIVDNAYHANSADYVQMAVSAHSAEIAVSALNVASADSATYDNLGREITATYLTAHQDVTDLPYVQNSALDYTPGGHLVSSISGDALYAVSAEGAFTAETANYSYVAETANYVADGWEYNENNEITGYSGSAIHSEAGGEGKVYTGVAPIVVDNSQTTGVISAQTARLGVQSPLYFVEDTSASTVIGISGLPEVEGLMYESALGLTGGSITSYNGSAFSAQGGGNPQVPVSGVSGISITKPGDTVLIGFTGNLTGQYIPYTTSTANEYFTNSAITVTSESGYVQITPKHTNYQNEAHVRVVANYTGGETWLGEIDGADSGHIHQSWSTGEYNYPAYLMDWTKNGLYYDYFTANNDFEVLASWTTGDWINAKALYNHVNSASANWANVQIVASTADATGANIIYFVTGA